MRSSQSLKRSALLCCIGLCLTLATPAAVGGDIIVETGWDLFETIPPTNFAGFPFEGVPLGTFDFGQPIGVRNTFTTDTIVQRLDVASVPNAPGTAPPILLELVALQLISVEPIDLGGGLDFHFITLDRVNASSGEMEITFDNPGGGTFSSFIDVDFDLRIGDLNGQVLFSDVLRLSANDVPWDRIAPPPALKILGVNHLLNRRDNSADFWPGFPGGPTGTKFFTEAHPSGAQHSVANAIPEPGTFALFAAATLLLTHGQRRGGRAA